MTDRSALPQRSLVLTASTRGPRVLRPSRRKTLLARIKEYEGGNRACPE